MAISEPFDGNPAHLVCSRWSYVGWHSRLKRLTTSFVPGPPVLTFSHMVHSAFNYVLFKSSQIQISRNLLRNLGFNRHSLRLSRQLIGSGLTAPTSMHGVDQGKS